MTFLCCSIYNNHLDILLFFWILNWFDVGFSRNDEEEEERPERPEKGTKVKRTLSSLRSRMTGSFNKDKVITHTVITHAHSDCGKKKFPFLLNSQQLLTSAPLQLPPFLECRDTKLTHADYWGSSDLIFQLDNVLIVYCILKNKTHNKLTNQSNYF